MTSQVSRYRREGKGRGCRKEKEKKEDRVSRTKFLSDLATYYNRLSKCIRLTYSFVGTKPCSSRPHTHTRTLTQSHTHHAHDGVFLTIGPSALSSMLLLYTTLLGPARAMFSRS